MFKVEVKLDTPFNIFALTEGPDTDSTDHLESVELVKLYDRDGLQFELTEKKGTDTPRNISIEATIKHGVDIIFTVNKETGVSTFCVKGGIVQNPGWQAEFKVVRGNHNRRPAVLANAVEADVPPAGVPGWVIKRGPEFTKEFVKRINAPESTEKDEWVLTIDSSFTNEWLGFMHGINDGMSLEDFVKLGMGHFSFRRRAELENNPEQRHPISYDIIVQLNADSTGYELLVYERTKLAGEERLVGGSSIGIGGHFDKSDTRYAEFNTDYDRPDVLATITDGIARERHQELVLISREGYAINERTKQNILNNPLANRFLGFLCDDEDPKKTGSYHIGLVSMLMLPPGVRAETSGQEERYLASLPLDQILSVPKLERWSVIVAQYLLDNQAELELVFNEPVDAELV